MYEISRLLSNILGITGSKNISIIEGDNNLIIQDISNSEVTVIQQIGGLSQSELIQKVIHEVQNFLPERNESIQKEINDILIAQPKKVFGREEDIEFIVNSLEQTNSLLLVSGIAGIGKSVTAYHYYSFFKHLYAHICWLNGSENIEDKLFNDVSLHTKLKIYDKTRPYLSPSAAISNEDSKHVLTIIEEALNALEPKVLFIIDDCDKANFKTIKRLQNNLPNSHFLITSRNRSADFVQRELGVLPLEKATELFYNFYSIEKDDQVVAEIIGLLQGHTLLIELVSKASQRGGFPLKKILDFLTDGHIEHQGLHIKVDINELRENRDVEDEEFIISYIKILLDSILTLTKEEKKIISDLSLLPNYPIEREKIVKLISDKKKASIENFKVVNDLADKGYLQVTNKVVQIHSLVGTAVREHISIALEDKKSLVENFLELIPFDSDVTDTEAFKSYNNISIGDSLLKYLPLPSTSNEVEYYGTMQNQMARLYNLFRNHDRAINLFQGYLSLLDNHSDNGKEDRLSAQKVSVTNNLAGAYMSKGLPSEAREMLGEIIQEQIDKHNFVSPQLLSSFGNACIDLGSYQEALKVLGSAKRIATSLYGPDSSAVAEASHNLGVVFQQLGNLLEAKEHLDEAKAIFRKLNGPDHRSTIQSDSISEKISVELGEHESAIAKLEARYKELVYIDPNHPMIESVTKNLASAYYANGDYKKAIETIERTISLLNEHYGSDFHLVYTLKNNASTYYEKDGQLDKAAEYAEEGLKYLRSKYPNNSSPRIAGRLSNLAVIYGRLGRIDEALKLYEEALEIDARSEVSKPEMAAIYSNIGSLHTAKKQFEKAIIFHQKSANIFIDNDNTNHPDFAIIQTNLGEAFYHDERPYEAYLCFKESLATGTKMLHSNHPKLISRNGNVRNALVALGCHFTAYKYAVESARISSDVKGDTIETASEINLLSDVQYHSGNLLESALNVKKAAEILLRYENSEKGVATLMSKYVERAKEAMVHQEKNSVPSLEEVGGLKFIG